MTQTFSHPSSGVPTSLGLAGLSLTAAGARRLLARHVQKEVTPLYVACLAERDRVLRLLAALRSPGETTYATCEIEGREGDFVAVPFASLREEARFCLNAIYLFDRQAVRRHERAYLSCSVTDYHEREQRAGTHIMVPLRLSPPWEACPPEYVSCMDRVQRTCALTEVLLPDTYPVSATLLGSEQAPDGGSYWAAPLSTLGERARAQLEKAPAGWFFCVYDSNRGVHPLLAHYRRRFSLCRVEQG